MGVSQRRASREDMAEEQRGIALQHASLCSIPGHKAELARRYNTKAAAPRKRPVS